MNKIKIIFIGGLSNGEIVLQYLQSNKYVYIPFQKNFLTPGNHPCQSQDMSEV